MIAFFAMLIGVAIGYFWRICVEDWRKMERGMGIAPRDANRCTTCDAMLNVSCATCHEACNKQ